MHVVQMKNGERCTLIAQLWKKVKTIFLFLDVINYYVTLSRILTPPQHFYKTGSLQIFNITLLDSVLTVKVCLTDILCQMYKHGATNLVFMTVKLC